MRPCANTQEGYVLSFDFWVYASAFPEITMIQKPMAMGGLCDFPSSVEKMFSRDARDKPGPSLPRYATDALCLPTAFVDARGGFWRLVLGLPGSLTETFWRSKGSI